MTLVNFNRLKKELPENMNLWLTEETKNSLNENIRSEDLQNVKAILYRNFLKQNPSFLNRN